MSRRVLIAAIVGAALLLGLCGTAQAALLSLAKAKQSIATETLVTFGGAPRAYGARNCERLAPNKVSCVGWIDDGKRTCSDRMKAIKSGGIHVTGVADPADWNCRPD